MVVIDRTRSVRRWAMTNGISMACPMEPGWPAHQLVTLVWSNILAPCPMPLPNHRSPLVVTVAKGTDEEVAALVDAMRQGQEDEQLPPLSELPPELYPLVGEATGMGYGVVCAEEAPYLDVTASPELASQFARFQAITRENGPSPRDPSRCTATISSKRPRTSGSRARTAAPIASVSSVSTRGAMASESCLTSPRNSWASARISPGAFSASRS